MQPSKEYNIWPDLGFTLVAVRFHWLVIVANKNYLALGREPRQLLDVNTRKFVQGIVAGPYK